MTKKKYVRLAKAAVVTSVIPVLLYAYSSGPDPGHAGVPGESTCVACHTGTLNSGPGSVKVDFPGGLTYTAGVKQRLVVTVADPDQRRWGFQLTARREADPKSQAGTFTPADGNSQVVCAAANLDQVACSATAPLQYIEHTSAGTRNGTRTSASFEFDWNPPASSAGNIVVYVAGNAANGSNTNAGDRIYTKTYTLTEATGGLKPAISSGEVTNGATFQAGLVQGSWVTIKGTNFGTNTRIWRGDEIVNGKLPTELDGVSVTINGKPAAVYFISPTQINVQAPSDDNLGNVPVEVTVSGVKSDTAQALLQKYAPGFFLWVGKYAVATDPNYAWRVAPGTFAGVATTAAKPGEVIIIWGTGFGPTNPAIPAGQAVDRAANLADTPTITIGGIEATYLGGALSQGAAGLYQIAVKVPDALGDGDWPVVATIGGVSSPSTALLTVKK